MRYVISDTFDKKELNYIFFADITPMIGKIFQLKTGKSYKILDIEFCESAARGTFVQGVLKRLS